MVKSFRFQMKTKYHELTKWILASMMIHVLSCIAIKNPTANIVQWREPPDGYANEVFYDLKPGQELKYYAGWRNMTIVFLTRPEDVRLRLDCRLMQLPDDARITKFRLLYGITDTLLDTRPQPYIHRFKDMEEMDWTVDYTDNRTGPIFSITLPKNKKIKLRKIKCRVENAVSEIGSNPLYIVDNRQAFDLDVKTVALASNISANQPSQFPCRKKIINAELFRPLTYEWFTVKDNDTVESLRELGQRLSWPVQILPDGALYWPYVSSAARESLQGKKLLCKVEGIKAAETIAALNIAQDGSSANAVTSLEMVPYPPSTLNVTIPRQFQPPVLSCPFKVGPGSYDVKWQWEGKDLKEGKNEEGVVVSGLQLRLEGLIDETKQSASISCQVTWTAKGGTKETKRTDFSVKLLHIPRFSNKVPFYKYAFDGGNASVACQIPKGSDFEVGFILDGTKLAAYDRPALVNKLQKISKRFGMDFKGDLDLFPKDVGLRGKSRTYTAIDMKMKKGSTRSTAFILQCRLFGPQIKKTPRLDVPDGFSLQPLKTVVMAVLPYPGIYINPVDYIDCNFCGPQKFTASLQNTIEMDYPDLEVVLEWFVLNTRNKSWKGIEVYKDVFSVDDGGRSLTISKSKKQLFSLGVQISEDGKLTSSLRLACNSIVKNTYTGELMKKELRWKDLLNTSVPVEGVYRCPEKPIMRVVLICLSALIVFVVLM